MVGELVVHTNKNEFLLYSMLNSLGQIRGNPDNHPIRRKTTDYFREYCGKGLKKEDYKHHSKPVSYVLTLNEAPNLSEKQGLQLDCSMEYDVNTGSIVLPHLIHFYVNTDFENFYQNILPLYNEECETLQGEIDKVKVKELLDDVWGMDGFDMEVILMPLESYRSGVGPSIGNRTYQIVGPPFDQTCLRLIAHEGSHPRLKKALEPVMHEISKREKHLEYARKDPNYPDVYNHWGTCFEEHFIRAMQAQFVDNVILGQPAEKGLEMERHHKGMVYIEDFADEIARHKSKPEGSLQDLAMRILERLDRKYK